MEKRFIEKDLTGDDYSQFLDFCSKNFDFFYLYRRSDLKPLSVKGEANVNLLNKFIDSRSIGDQFLSGEKMYSENIYLEIYKYVCNDESIQSLSKIKKSLFSWQLPHSLEDLSFENIKNNTTFFSISHESYAQLSGPQAIIKQFDEAFPNFSLARPSFRSNENELSKDWVEDENGNYIYTGDDE